MFKHFFILNCVKDTCIHNYYEDANVGKAFVLPMLHNFDGSTSPSKYSRALLDFNIDDVIDYFGVDALTSNSFTATLYLTQLKYDEYDHSTEFYIDLFPLTSSWAEGYNASEHFDEIGYANWNYKSKNSAWSTTGGDYIQNTSLSAEAFLTDGYEDIKFDVTEYISGYISTKYNILPFPFPFSTTADFRGFLLKFRNESVSAFEEYKRFYSAHTHTIYNPKILIEVETTTEYDSRQKFILGKSQSLYFPYRTSGEIDISLSSSDITFSVLKDNVALTSITATVSGTPSGILKSTFVIPESEYSSTSVFKDVWSITGQNAITGTFNVVRESDVVGLDLFSLTGNFNKNYVSHSLIQRVGVASQYNKEMYYDTQYIFRFMPYIKSQSGVDNIGLIMNNELIYPTEFYVKFLDAESNYEWTNWIQLDLINDAYLLNVNTNSFRIGATMIPLFRFKIWDSYTIVKGTKNDIFKIIKES